MSSMGLLYLPHLVVFVTDSICLSERGMKSNRTTNHNLFFIKLGIVKLHFTVYFHEDLMLRILCTILNYLNKTQLLSKLSAGLGYLGDLHNHVTQEILMTSV